MALRHPAHQISLLLSFFLRVRMSLSAYPPRTGLLTFSAGAFASNLDLTGAVRSDEDARALAAGLASGRSAVAALRVSISCGGAEGPAGGSVVGPDAASALLLAVAGSASLRRFVWCAKAAGSRPTSAPLARARKPATRRHGRREVG